ncbi:hypothetical protein GUJ93_ZPchr0008g14047 [Zizania palustris]|uniref:Uncharacterized protein n=1 Tax=Zizania palustris TaxID=103762 RepID=A0A8J5RUI0_ZIZPA|nr:hypothetical protein GUJ93_ZPchr0008g14047 [Zizania palustris]
MRREESGAPGNEARRACPYERATAAPHPSHLPLSTESTPVVQQGASPLTMTNPFSAAPLVVAVLSAVDKGPALRRS